MELQLLLTLISILLLFRGNHRSGAHVRCYIISSAFILRSAKHRRGWKYWDQITTYPYLGHFIYTTFKYSLFILCLFLKLLKRSLSLFWKRINKWLSYKHVCSILAKEVTLSSLMESQFWIFIHNTFSEKKILIWEHFRKFSLHVYLCV